MEPPFLQKCWLERLPKKLTEPLITRSATTNDTRLIEAWGVHVNEGLDATMVFWTMLLALAISLGPLLGGYIYLTSDVQSATGIGSIVLGVMAILWMCMQIETARTT